MPSPSPPKKEKQSMDFLCEYVVLGLSWALYTMPKDDA
jgi:hypothetical protein